MNTTNDPFNFHRWAEDKVYEILRSQRIGKKKALALSKVVVGVAGPGKGHRAVKYRISAGTKDGKPGWWMSEFGPADAHDNPTVQVSWVPEKVVKRLWRVIKKAFPVSAKYTNADLAWYEVPKSYRFNLPETVQEMGRQKMLPKRFRTQTFYSGVNRKALYFPLYLYPARILDHLGRIRFGMTSWRLE